VAMGVAAAARVCRTVGVALGTVGTAMLDAAGAVGDGLARPGVGTTVDVAGPVADGIPVGDGLGGDGEVVAVGRAVGAIGTGVALVLCAGGCDGACVPCPGRP
jgi:hypothetical protein